jgi:hypothetical protein
VSQTTVPAQLLGLDGVEFDLIEREADGSFAVHVTTGAGASVRCPGCGAVSGRVKGVHDPYPHSHHAGRDAPDLA